MLKGVLDLGTAKAIIRKSTVSLHDQFQKDEVVSFTELY